jgi:uncharacterized protein (TIGR03437 family)
LIANSTVMAQSTPFAVVSAASYQPGGAVAPDSLAALFGVNLAGSKAWATLDQNGQLPTNLGGTSVEVNGEAASLLYVSASQINFVVPGDAATGTADVLVRNTVTSAEQSATMLVQNTAAAVFSADGTGKGPGAILNAVTYAAAPFLVETPEIAGSDQRTRLAVYATGLRYAASVGASATNPSGNSYNLTVEYAGPAPGYFGLDQVNIVLPPDLDGAGVVSLFLAADGSASNLVSFLMASLPANSIRLAALSFSPSYVNGGDNAILTISLNGVARSMGFPVSLRSNNTATQVPLLVTVPAGRASLQVTIPTSPVTTVQTVTITAQGETAALEIDPANALAVSALSVTPTSVLGGRNVSATVALTGTAPPGGVSIGISSDNPNAKPPATVSVPFTANSSTFSILTSAVTASQTCNVTATLGRSSQTTQITVIPGLQLALASSSIVGGNNVGGTVTIADSAQIGGANVNLQSSDSIAKAPSFVNIPSGQISAPFTITTTAVTAARTVTITATYGSLKQSATLTVNPPGSPTLTGVTVSPAYVTGGMNATGTVTLGAAAPLGGIIVSLQSSPLGYAQVPSFVTVPQGATTASFTIQTYHVTSTQTVTITATAGSVSETAVLTVQ